MNELSVLASETHEKALAYFRVAEQYGYKFIMEVKKIRDDRLYKELGCSSFDEYCDSSWSTKRDSMDERIKIATEFGSNFDGTYRQLGHSKSLMLARMDPEVREQIESTVIVSETTVKQLKQLENQLKEQSEILESVKSDAEHWQKVAKTAQSMPPRVESRTVEVAPRDYGEVKAKAARLDTLENELTMYKRKAELNEKEAQEFAELKKQIAFLHQEKNDLNRKIESATALSGLTVKIDHFLKTELAPIRYSRALERMDSDVAVRNLSEILDSVDAWITDMRRYLPKNNRKVVIEYDPAG